MNIRTVKACLALVKRRFSCSYRHALQSKFFHMIWLVVAAHHKYKTLPR